MLQKNEENKINYISHLNSQNWLNDEVINEYLKLLKILDDNVFIFTSYFHTAFRAGGFKRVENYYRKYDLLEYTALYIPVHKENHWYLITFNGIEVVVYDPFNYPQCSKEDRQKLFITNQQT